MLAGGVRVPVFAYRRPVDLRKGFEGLSALVQQALGKNPLSGALYLFTNRRRTTAKVLQFDGTGRRTSAVDALTSATTTLARVLTTKAYPYRSARTIHHGQPCHPPVLHELAACG